MAINIPGMIGNPKLRLTPDEQKKAREAIKDLRDYHKLPYHELALQLNCSSSMTNGWYHYGRAVGRTYFEPLINLHFKYSRRKPPQVP